MLPTALGTSLPSGVVAKGPSRPDGWLTTVVSPFREFGRRLGEIRRASPRWLFWLLVAEYAALFLLALWVPGNDYDSMTSYVARIKLAEFGPLRETATLEIQYLFPTFFDFLHAPFLKLGWFTAFPNFALFTAALIAVVCLFEPPVAARWLLGCAAAAPVLVAVTALKNDVSLALIAFLAWAIVFYMRPSAVFPASALAAIAALVGTKWHGFFVAPPLFVCLLWRMYRERKTVLTWRAAALVVLAGPLLWWMSSASVYLDNLRHEGSLCPRLNWLGSTDVDAWRNAKAFAVNNALETFELPLYLIEKKKMHGRLWPKVKEWSLQSKAYGYLIAPHSQLAAFGLPILLVIFGCIAALLSSRVPGPARVSAAIALIYLAACLKSFYYCDWFNRYFLVTYILGLAPCAYLIADWRPPRLLRWAAYGWIVLTAYQSIVWNLEKPLVRRALFHPEGPNVYEHPPIWPAIWSGDRNRLYFQVWGNHYDMYKFMKANIASQDHLLIINRYQGNNVPFLYPHIMDRDPGFTVVVSDRNGQTPPAGFEERFKFIMVHNGNLANPRYREVRRCDDVILYQRIDEP